MVPTWNYIVVHAYGALDVIDDPVWVRQQIESLTTQQEAVFDKPWAISDAPAEFTDRMISAIVGIEITITKLTGKWKVSQNQPAKNQAGVIEGLQTLDKSEATEIACLIQKLPQSLAKL